MIKSLLQLLPLCLHPRLERGGHRCSWCSQRCSLQYGTGPVIGQRVLPSSDMVLVYSTLRLPNSASARYSSAAPMEVSNAAKRNHSIAFRPLRCRPYHMSARGRWRYTRTRSPRTCQYPPYYRVRVKPSSVRSNPMHTVVWCGWQVGFRLDSVTTQEYLSKWLLTRCTRHQTAIGGVHAKDEKTIPKVTLRCDHVWGHHDHLCDEEIEQIKRLSPAA